MEERPQAREPLHPILLYKSKRRKIEITKGVAEEVFYRWPRFLSFSIANFSAEVLSDTFWFVCYTYGIDCGTEERDRVRYRLHKMNHSTLRSRFLRKEKKYEFFSRKI